ncbi:MAG: carbohydrate ABC transporter permease [Planctomycetota bacterium]
MSRGPGSSVPLRLAAYAVLAAAAAVVLVPLLYLVTSSFKPAADFFTSMFLPLGDGFLGVRWDALTLEQFRKLGQTDIDLPRAMVNSIFLSSVTSVLATLICAAAGYALTVYRFRARAAADWLVVAALIIPPPLLIAPSYQWLHTLGLLDSYAGLILPAIAPAFGVYLFRQAAKQSIPPAMVEAARVDGASELTIFFGIGLPMLRPMIGAFVIITFLAMWNNFIGPQVVLQSDAKQPLAVAIYQTQTGYYSDYGVLMAATLVAVAPVAVLFLFLQREFLSGLTSGAVKG